MKNTETCTFCRLPKAHLHCGLCNEPVCKSCKITIATDHFSMITPVTLSENPNLKTILPHQNFCSICFDSTVQPEIERYQALLEKAKQVGFWSKLYKGNVPVLKKSNKEIVISESNDKDDLILRLGFHAAELGFNALIQADIKSSKIRRNNDPKGYQSTIWSGKAIPAIVDMEKVEREEFREAHWRVLNHR